MSALVLAAGSSLWRRARVRRGRIAWPGVALGAAALSLVGCVQIVRTDVREDSPVPRASLTRVATEHPEGEIADAWRSEQAWPERWGRPARGGSRLGVVRRVLGPIAPLRSGEAGSQKMEQEMLRDINVLLESRRSASWRDEVTIVGEGRGSFVYEYEKPREPRVDPSPRSAAFFLKFISGTPAPDSEPAGRAGAAPGTPSGTNAPAAAGNADARSKPADVRAGVGTYALMQRTWLGLYDPVVPVGVDPATIKPRALVVLFPGIFGTPPSVVDQFTSTLRARGYAVLRVLAHPSRFTERALLDYTGSTDADLDAFARRVADLLGDRTAECAYAVQEAMVRVEQERPDLRGLPRLAVGMSGGAMVLPTVIAREPDAYAGAVLIAGGVDFCRIAAESDYSKWIKAVQIQWHGKPLSRAQSLALSAAYRRHAPLDSCYTAAALAGKPVLMLHAQDDTAVPAELGEELWQLLGRPDRWTFDSGHELLFLALSWHVDRIADWLEAHTPPGAAKH